MKECNSHAPPGLALTGAHGVRLLRRQVRTDPNPICPLIYAPVTCNDGVTYSNQCFADAACAKGCRPWEAPSFPIHPKGPAREPASFFLSLGNASTSRCDTTSMSPQTCPHVPVQCLSAPGE